MKIVVAFAL